MPLPTGEVGGPPPIQLTGTGAPEAEHATTHIAYTITPAWWARVCGPSNRLGGLAFEGWRGSAVVNGT